MTNTDFDQLVRKVETGVGRNHGALRRRTAWLALIGYAGLLWPFFLILLMAAGFFSTMVWGDPDGRIVCGIAGGLVLGLGGWGTLRGVLTRISPPQGRIVTRTESPALFAELDDLRTRLDSAPFHAVLLTAECNAGVVQWPRLGLLGWPRNYLILGLPLLEILAPTELRAVLAHECVHLSRRHGRLSHWLYRLRRSWEEQFRQYSTRPRSSGLSPRALTVKFVNWFWPRFNAHAFVLSRANESEADAIAAELAGGAQLAAALTRLEVVSRLLQHELWPALWRLAQTEPLPPGDLLGRLRGGMRAGPTAADRTRWTEEAFRAVSSNADTHPCLTERLRALRLPSAPLPGGGAAPTPSAAEALLQPALDPLRRDVQARWAAEAAPRWRTEHARATALNDRLTALDRAVPATAANVESRWDKVQALLHLHDHAAALPLLREIIERQADHAPAHFQLGRLLLDAGDPACEAHLEWAMAADEEMVPTACNLLHQHFRQLGRADALRGLAARLDRYHRERAASQTERQTVSAKDRFLAHDLPGAELEALRRTLSAEGELGRAELAQKELKFFKQQRLYVLCVRGRPAWHRLPLADRDRALASRLAMTVRLPGRVVVIPPAGAHGAVARKVGRVPNSTVWP